MHKGIRRFVMFASVVALAASSVNCANSPEQSNASVLAPSSLGDAALAARGGGGKPGGGGTVVGGGSISSPVMVTDLNGDSVPSFRDTVTFVVQTTATAYPYVVLKCYQGGTLVSSDSNAMFAGSLDQKFTLGPTGNWTGGAANCTANLENRDGKGVVVLASTSFLTN